MKFDTPIVLFVYKRPKLVRQLISVLRFLKPSKLYIFADGPSEDFIDQVQKCQDVRDEIGKIDWDCKLYFKAQPKNIGLRKSIVSGLNHVFDLEEMAIILEDDCFPNIDFFYFCENLLFRYANNDYISVISGNNFQCGQVRGSGSYYFSKYSHCWGWATWSRSWKNYDDQMTFWPAWKTSNEWLDLNSSQFEKAYWEKIFDDAYRGQINSWAYRWLASNWYLGKLTILPNVNLVSNVGFDSDATHTKSDIYIPPIATHRLGEIKHPKLITRDLDADFYTYQHHYGGLYKLFPYKYLLILKKIIPANVKNIIKSCLIKINSYRFLRRL